MISADWKRVLARAEALALSWYASLPERPVGPRATARVVLDAIDRPVPEVPSDPVDVLEDLARKADPGLTAIPGGRFFGWVIGGGLPSSVAADWLTTAWDQNAGSAEGTPSAAAFEQVALRWVIELLDLPRHASGALVTGTQMAHVVCLAAARTRLLSSAGWDVERDGLFGAPRIRALVGGERHDTVDKALRLLGFGSAALSVVDVDSVGRMVPAALERSLGTTSEGAIVCVQAGNVNGGAIDALSEIAAIVEGQRARGRPCWLHVDGAFGLWARASRNRAALARGAERADSWATDAHKWLNTPYDLGVALTAHPDDHRRAMSIHAGYLPQTRDPGVRVPSDFTPELSRRARGFALYAALHELGRSGVSELVERCCTLAARFAEGLARVPGAEVLNEVTLNQVVVRLRDPSGVDDDEHTRQVVARVAEEGTCVVSATSWRGGAGLRVSVSNWSTTEEDVQRSVDAIARAHLREHD